MNAGATGHVPEADMGTLRRFAKPLSGLLPTVGSNPTPSAFEPLTPMLSGLAAFCCRPPASTTFRQRPRQLSSILSSSGAFVVR